MIKKKKGKKRSHTQISHEKKVNPRDNGGKQKTKRMVKKGRQTMLEGARGTRRNTGQTCVMHVQEFSPPYVIVHSLLLRPSSVSSFHRQTDRQTNRQTDRQAGRQTGRQADRQAGTQTDKHKTIQ